MKKLVAAAALLPASALAHGEPASHVHPHGMDLAILAAFVVVAFIGWKLFRR